MGEMLLSFIVEPLVVIAVIGVATALLFPAVQAARESVEWTNNSQQVLTAGQWLAACSTQSSKLPCREMTLGYGTLRELPEHILSVSFIVREPQEFSKPQSSLDCGSTRDC